MRKRPIMNIEQELVLNSCTREHREYAARLIAEQRKLLRKLQASFVDAYFVDDYKTALADMNVNGHCHECGIPSGHTGDCVTGIKQVLYGFEKMNIKMREALDLGSGESLSGAIAKLHEERKNDPTKTKIKSLPLSVRAANVLYGEQMVTVGDLLKLSYRDVQRLPNMGRKSILEIRTALAGLGLDLIGAPR